MNPDVKRLWVDALRSGKFTQGYHVLSDGDRHCCLGVLCDLAIENGVPISKTLSVEHEYASEGYTYGSLYSYSKVSLPDEVMEWAGLEHSTPEVILPRGNASVEAGCSTGLDNVNDSGEADFNFIADLIEEQL